MEAAGEPKHRTTSEALIGQSDWARLPRRRRPKSDRVRRVEEPGAAGHRLILSQEISKGPRRWGKPCEGNDNRLMPLEKSDCLVVARKSGNADGAKRAANR